MHWASSQFFDQTFDETLSLLEEARHHVDMVSHGGLEGQSQENVLRTVRDLSYLTSQVTGMMSLLMLYKATAEGEVSETEFRSCSTSLTSELELTGAALAKDTHANTENGSPMLLSLLDRSDRLMHRIYSLQGMPHGVDPAPGAITGASVGASVGASIGAGGLSERGTVVHWP